MKHHLRYLPIWAAVATFSFLNGCASNLTNVAPTPPAQYSSLGTVTGSACGSLGILGTSTYFIPAGLNDRVERAYQAALASQPGATSLTNITMQEDWYWWLVGTFRCVTITGEAVK